MIRLLFLASSPSDESRIRIDKEMADIDRHLCLADVRHRFAIEQKWAVRADELQTHLRTSNPQIVHFAGHGSEGVVLMEDVDGYAKRISAQTFGEVLGQFAPPLRCAVLNACFSDSLAQAIAAYVDCVIAWPAEVPDEAATAFAESFYQSLGKGESLEQAFRSGQLQIKLALDDRQWQPTLYIRDKAIRDLTFVSGASIADERIFTNVWYTSKRYSFWEVRNPDIGTLIVCPDQIIYQGERIELQIDNLIRVKHFRQGGSINNNWVRVEYLINQQTRTAYFAQASRLGIGELIGGSHALLLVLRSWPDRPTGQNRRER